MTAEIKRENHRLRRQVSQLQRELERMEPLSDPPPETEPKPRKKKGPACLSCGFAALIEFTTPSGMKLLVCSDCQARQRKPSP